jgi:TRAP-type C4-dicarboxylate transport system permease large subunit
VPLYAFMTLIAGGYFLLFEDHPAGLAIYTQLLAAHPLLYIPVGLYVWIGMLMKQTQVAPMTFDLLRPWRLPPELLAFVVVALAAVPTAYSGASGIFVMAVGGLVYQELRRAGARRQLAHAATAMSGSLGVVLRPCLLVVIVASLNKDVTTDELYGWGLWVYLGTAGMFLVATLLLRRGEAPMQIAPVAEAAQGMKAALLRLAPYAGIVVGVLVFYAVGLGTVVDEHTAPQVLPVVVLALLSSIGVAGIPAASLVAIVIILQALGLPLEAIAIVMATDRILDMMRTTVNVFGDTTAAVVIAASEGEKIYPRDAA